MTIIYCNTCKVLQLNPSNSESMCKTTLTKLLQEVLDGNAPRATFEKAFCETYYEFVYLTARKFVNSNQDAEDVANGKWNQLEDIETITDISQLVDEPSIKNHSSVDLILAELSKKAPLSEDVKKILVFRFSRGLTYKEIGQRLDMTEAQVKMKVKRWIDKFKK